MKTIEALIRGVSDFPQPGILFRDITPLLADAAAFARCIGLMAGPWRDARVQAVCGIESRGFIFGAALAQQLRAGFVPLRKPGKLPPPVHGVDYQLEYGSARLEVPASALAPGERVLIVDDVLATGGTLAAACTLVRMQGVDVLGAGVVIELDALHGRQRCALAAPLHSVLHY